MSVSSTNNRNDYTGNNSTAVYNYTFRILDEADLRVIERDDDDVETVLELDTDYTVSGVDELAGGQITLLGGNLATGHHLTIRRVVELTQETDIRNQGDFFPEVHEDTFDKQMFISQQQQDEINRSLKLPETVLPSEFDPTLPTAITTPSSLALVTKADGSGWEMGPTTADISGANASAVAAAASATAAAASATAADASADAAAVSETNAANSATAAAASATAAQTAETNAETAETNAETAETNAAASATAAAGSATTATTQATNASNSATAAATSATNAANSATAAATSATNAATSETNAAASAATAADRVQKSGDTMTGDLIMQAMIRAEEQVDSATTGSGQSITPTRSIIKLTNASLTSINNIASPQNGKLLILINGTGASLTLTNNSGGTAANRIITGSGADLMMLNGASVWLAYDSDASRWQVVGGSGGGGTQLFGTRAAPRSIVAATGIVSGSSHMSTVFSDQTVFIEGSVADAEADVSANPQIQAHTIVGSKMRLIGRSDTAPVLLQDGTGLALKGGDWLGYENSVLDLMWDGTNWVETSRN